MSPREQFDTTRWSVVQAAGADNSIEARRALEILCDTYWYPLYAYIRRQGYNAEDGADLTQALFASLLERNAVAGVRRERGKFRSFLLAAARHFLLNDVVHRQAVKRGGGVHMASIDVSEADRRFSQEPVDAETPEKIFDRQWALAVIERAVGRLRRDWRGAGKGHEFDALKPCLMGEKPPGGYAGVAVHLGSTEGAVKVAAHRLRRQFQRCLRDEIAQTVGADVDIDEEIRDLLRALSS